MSAAKRRKKALSYLAAAFAWACLFGSVSASISLVQDGPFAGRGDHRGMTGEIARIVMARAGAPGETPDPFVVE